MTNKTDAIPSDPGEQLNGINLSPIEIELGGLAVAGLTTAEIGGAINNRVVEVIGAIVCVASFLSMTASVILRRKHQS